MAAAGLLAAARRARPRPAQPRHVRAGCHAAFLAITTGSLALSSRPYIRLFGLLTVGAFLVAYAVYAAWLISVWCFFAAALSAIVWLHFAARPVPTAAAPSGSPAYGWHSPL